MTRTRSRALLALVAGLTTFTLLTGCGGSDAKPASGTPSATASSSAPSSGTSGTTPAAFVAGLSSGFAKYSTVHMEIASEALLNVQGDVDYADAGDPKIRMTIDLGGEREVIVAGGAVYMRQGPAGAKYAKLDTSDPTYGAVLGSLSGFSPKDAVDGLAPAFTKVEDKGAATVDGTDVTRYRVTMDASKVEGVFTSLVGSTEPGTTLADLYVDGDGLLHRLETDVSGQKLTLTLSKWGEKVSIRAPRGDQLLNP